MTDKQNQKGGTGSTNVQIGTLSAGLTYADVRDIATDVFNQNFVHLTKSASDTANDRAAVLRDEVISELKKSPGADPSSFSQVEKQVALLEAQKAYAISGDEELRELLVKAVVEVSKSPERSKKSIIMSEAIKIAPLLTPEQLRTLGLVFAISQVSFTAHRLKDLFRAYADAIRLSKAKLALTMGDLRHLEYAGCGSLGIAGTSWHALLTGDYAGLIQKGFSKEEADQSLLGVNPFPPMRPAQRGPGPLELAFRRSQDIDEIMVWSAEQRQKIKEFLQARLLNQTELDETMSSLGDDATYIYQQWTELGLTNFKLTSVGIAIGYAFISDNLSKLPDINIWL